MARFLAYGAAIRFFLTVFTAWALLTSESPAHPAHAEPVEYPFVIGFERFYAGDGDPIYLAEGGRLLLNELNCVTCHEPPELLEAQFTGRIGTRLDGVGVRLDPIDLELMIRNPRFVKRDTIMPSLFAGPDRDLDQIEALKHYMVSLNSPPPTVTAEAPGDPDIGRKIYHRLGCVACHAPEVGFIPDDLLEGLEIELVGLPSSPMNLADRYTEEALIDFLLHPLKHRPAGRMPETQLSNQEAIHLARYLKLTPPDVLPSNLATALGQDEPFVLDAALVEQGKGLFFEKNCVACHEAEQITEDRNFQAPQTGPPLIELATAGRSGCLSERPVEGGVPAYFLDTVQIRAIELALASLETVERTDATELDFEMMALNCYACHERGGKGGVEFAREPYFSFDDRRAIELGRQGYLPPGLDVTERKLTRETISTILNSPDHAGRVRPWMSARMPRFLPENTAHLEELLQRVVEGHDAVLKGRADEGKAIFKGLDCGSCHGEGSRLPGIDLRTSAQRLRPGFFRDFLRDPWVFQPETIMPQPFTTDAESDQSIADLWEYLRP